MKNDGGPAFPTDAEMLDFLQSMVGTATGLVTCRMSRTGRGMRLHEHTTGRGSVREAIADAMLKTRGEG